MWFFSYLATIQHAEVPIMPLTKPGLVFIVLILLFSVVISYFVFSNVVFRSIDLPVRLLALNGFFFLSVASVMSAFVKEVWRNIGRPYLQVHHFFAAIGIALSLHPLTYAAQTLNPNVFLPRFDSLISFFTWGGIIALILVYTSLFAALLMKRIQKYFRIIHPIVIIALFFAVVHANLLGLDFANSNSIRIVYDLLFVSTLGAFILKHNNRYKVELKS